MKRKSSRWLSSCGLHLLIFISLSAIPAFAQEPGESVHRGTYSLTRVAPQDYLVTGVRLSQLSEAVFGKMRIVDMGLSGKWGRYYTLFQMDEKKQIRITVAVYASVAEAEDAVLDLLNDVSAIMRPGSRSGEVLGTHSWYMVSSSGNGTIVFTYYNALVQLFSLDYVAAEGSATEILRRFESGTNGVQLGKRVFSPQLTDIEVPPEMVTGQLAPLILKAQDPLDQKLSFVVTASKGQLLETKEPEERIYVPREVGSDELRVYAVNETNVVSELFVKKVEVGK